MKSYMYYEYAGLLNSGQNEKTFTIENIVKDNQLVREIYNALMMKVLQVFDQFTNESEVIKVLFELSQKKVIAQYFVKDQRIQHFFKNIKYAELCKTNRQDFLSLGHVIFNLLVFINIPKGCKAIYKDMLIKEFIDLDDNK